MILPTPTTINIEVCYIPKDVRSRYRSIWCKDTDFRTCQFKVTGHCTKAGCFVVDLVRPVNGLPPDLPTAASAGLVELIKDALKDRFQEVSVKRSVIDLDTPAVTTMAAPTNWTICGFTTTATFSKLAWASSHLWQV